jgi:hypothetical protein
VAVTPAHLTGSVTKEVPLAAVTRARRSPGRGVWAKVAYPQTPRGAFFPADPQPLPWEFTAFRWAEGAERGKAW